MLDLVNDLTVFFNLVILTIMTYARLLQSLCQLIPRPFFTIDWSVTTFISLQL